MTATGLTGNPILPQMRHSYETSHTRDAIGPLETYDFLEVLCLASSKIIFGPYTFKQPSVHPTHYCQVAKFAQNKDAVPRSLILATFSL